jgi:hypothetical protein
MLTTLVSDKLTSDASLLNETVSQGEAWLPLLADAFHRRWQTLRCSLHIEVFDTQT